MVLLLRPAGRCYLLQKEDLRALAIVLLECILSALARGGPSQLTTAESIQVQCGAVSG